LIQNLFEQDNKEQQNKIFENIKPEAFKLMSDAFGNFVI
jgi:hypothetical protein